jgi:hypothetical protein
LIQYLAANDAEALGETWCTLLAKGPDWRRRALEGLKELGARYPEVDTTALWAAA